MESIYNLLMRGEGIGGIPPEPKVSLNTKAIGNKTPGDIITLGDRQYIILGREENGVAVTSYPRIKSISKSASIVSKNTLVS